MTSVPGIEDNRAALEYSLVGADTVICPVDCVSHDARQRVKRYCKLHCKQFMALNGSGLSAFNWALHNMPAQTALL
jgi:hypothetical protein